MMNYSYVYCGTKGAVTHEYYHVEYFKVEKLNRADEHPITHMLITFCSDHT